MKANIERGRTIIQEKNKNFNLQYKIRKGVMGITLVALVITIIIIIILVTVAISFAFGNNGLINRAEDARDMYANDTAYTEGSIANVESYINDILVGTGGSGTDEPDVPPIPEEPATDGTYSEKKKVNTPKLGANMQLVVFDSSTNTWKEDTTKEAYSYLDTSIAGNENKSEWANAKVTTQVGNQTVESYFVWIPRYAYKITYYTDANKTTESETPTVYGTIDIKFIKETGKETVDGTPCKYVSENPTANDYIVHPAFTDEEENGGWDTQIPGIWVGKYETARSDTIGATQGSATTLKVQPGVTSLRGIAPSQMYTYALSYASDLESHMLKNSEWGAVAYLTESKYGRNGEEVAINENDTFYTGGGIDNDYVLNTSQSSTGNVYGIYDLAGNAWEYVAAAYSQQSSIDTLNGSNKYGTVYSGTNAKEGYKYGDATYETSGWHGDDSKFWINNDWPFWVRGGGKDYSDATIVGIFNFSYNGGIVYLYSSFRLALII